MKQPKNKFTAICIYFAPYITAVACIVVYAVFVNLFRNLACNWMLIEQDIWGNILTYVPISIAFIVVAMVVNKLIQTKVDLSIIGIKQAEKKGKSSVFSFLLLAICLICAFVSVGFACSFSDLEVKKVKGQIGPPSYYVVDTGFMGVAPTKTIITKDVKWEYLDGKYTLKLRNGKEYDIKKDSDAGKAFSQLVNF